MEKDCILRTNIYFNGKNTFRKLLRREREHDFGNHSHLDKSQNMCSQRYKQSEDELFSNQFVSDLWTIWGNILKDQNKCRFTEFDQTFHEFKIILKTSLLYNLFKWFFEIYTNQSQIIYSFFLHKLFLSN